MSWPDEVAPPPARSPGAHPRPSARFFLGLLISALFLWLALGRVPLHALRAAAAAWPLVPILFCLILQILATLVRLARWGIAVRRLGQIAWRRSLCIGSFGLSCVFLLPARVGELARPLLLAEESDIDFGRASAIVVMERLCDGWVMSAAILATLLAHGAEWRTPLIATGASAFGGLFLVATAFLGAGLAWRDRVVRLTRAVLSLASDRFAGYASDLVSRFFRGLRQLAGIRLWLPYGLLSLALWAVEAWSIYALLGILPGPLPFLAAMSVLSALVVGNTLPAGPAHLGTFEYAAILGLAMYDVIPRDAAAFALLLHAANIVNVLGFGLLGLWAGGYRLGRVWDLTATSEPRRN